MADIRMMEDEVKRELDQKLNSLGMATTEDSTTAGSIRSTPY